MNSLLNVLFPLYCTLIPVFGSCRNVSWTCDICSWTSPRCSRTSVEWYFTWIKPHKDRVCVTCLLNHFRSLSGARRRTSRRWFDILTFQIEILRCFFVFTLRWLRRLLYSILRRPLVPSVTLIPNKITSYVAYVHQRWSITSTLAILTLFATETEKNLLFIPPCTANVVIYKSLR